MKKVTCRWAAVSSSQVILIIPHFQHLLSMSVPVVLRLFSSVIVYECPSSQTWSTAKRSFTVCVAYRDAEGLLCSGFWRGGWFLFLTNSVLLFPPIYWVLFLSMFVFSGSESWNKWNYSKPLLTLRPLVLFYQLFLWEQMEWVWSSEEINTEVMLGTTVHYNRWRDDDTVV